MNLKHFYYRTYFEQGIELAQPPKGSDDRKANETANESRFKEYNSTLTKRDITKPYDPPAELKIDRLHLEVLNPGLLPGVGYPHEVGYPGEFKLGFSFDHTTGLPVLPGSSVKGVVRSVFPNVEDPLNPVADERQKQKARFVFGLLKHLDGKNKVEGLDAIVGDAEQLAFVVALELAMFCGLEAKGFGTPELTYERIAIPKHDVFLDALPVKFNQLLGRDALTPHGDNALSNPIPLPFVKVMPEVVFGFYFRLNETTIGDITITPRQKKVLIDRILCSVGAGAKTNVGYGQFKVTAQKIEQRSKAANSSASTDIKLVILKAYQKNVLLDGVVIGPDEKKKGKTKVMLPIEEDGRSVNRSFVIDPELPQGSIVKVLVDTDDKGKINKWTLSPNP